MNNKN